MQHRHCGIGSSQARSGRGTAIASTSRKRSTAEWCAASLRARAAARLLSPLTQTCAAHSQLDDYKAAERERDRSARQRPEDDGAQAAKRKKAKREQMAAEEVAAAMQACRAVACTVNANVREGRFVTFNVRPARDMWRVQNGSQRVCQLTGKLTDNAASRPRVRPYFRAAWVTATGVALPVPGTELLSGFWRK